MMSETFSAIADAVQFPGRVPIPGGTTQILVGNKERILFSYRFCILRKKATISISNKQDGYLITVTHNSLLAQSSMECYLYELPTTGSISFSDICLDNSCKYTADLSAATTLRANLRATLKESKRTDGEKDYLKLVKVTDDYLPHLYGVLSSIDAGDISLKAEPVFSWRTTLSSNLFNSSPRVPVVGLRGELAFTLLTYAFALSNLARVTLISLGEYERDRHILESERRAKDEKLTVAVNLLSRASGVFLHIAEIVLPQWELANPASLKNVPDLNKDVIMSLSSLTLSDAQNIAIRKLMSKSTQESLVVAGQALPKSHPSPALIAKLYLHVAGGYTSALSLATSYKPDEISSELRKYLAFESAFALALAHKWLGVDAGESSTRGGEAVSFLKWAKEELEDLKGKKISLGIASGNQKQKVARIFDELASVTTFLTNYKKINDSVHFHPVPSTSTLQHSIPTGRSAVIAKPFEQPRPIFGPRSLAHAQQTEDSVSVESSSQTSPHYLGAGSYF